MKLSFSIRNWNGIGWNEFCEAAKYTRMTGIELASSATIWLFPVWIQRRILWMRLLHARWTNVSASPSIWGSPS